MKLLFILFLIGIVSVSLGWPIKEPISDDQAKKFLFDFGYLPASDGSHRSSEGPEYTENPEAVRMAILKYQQFSSLPLTGELDVTTKTKMQAPRCGVVDVQPFNLQKASTWKKKHLTYTFYNYSPDLSKEDIRASLRRAFDIWSSVVPLDFSETADDAADIKIKFGARQHGDIWPFDGPFGILAHVAGMGNIHFDEDENWKMYHNYEQYDRRKIDLMTVALHEIGHVLGLEHTKEKQSIMQANYYDPIDAKANYIEPKLMSADIHEIQQLYGVRSQCTVQKGKDIRDSNLHSFPGSPEDCCAYCNETPACKAYTWDDYKGGTCWLKSATTPVIDSEGSIMGLIDDGCKQLRYKEIRDGNLTPKLGNIEDCCDYCKNTANCKAYTWDDFRGGTCWLKETTGPLISNLGSVTGIL